MIDLLLNFFGVSDLHLRCCEKEGDNFSVDFSCLFYFIKQSSGQNVNFFLELKHLTTLTVHISFKFQVDPFSTQEERFVNLVGRKIERFVGLSSYILV